PLLGAQRAQLPQVGARDQLRPRRPGRGGARGGGVRRRRGPARARQRGRGPVRGSLVIRPVPVKQALVDTEPTAPVTLAELPLRPELVGEQPYGAPQLSVPHLLNVNENPYPPTPEVVADAAEAVAAAMGAMNRYPERDAIGLRTDLAGHLGHGLTADNVWAANGSNEVMLHLMLAFAGPDRTALGFAPTYSMYPEYARDSHTRWVTVDRAADFTLDVDAALAGIAEHRPDV